MKKWTSPLIAVVLVGCGESQPEQATSVRSVFTVDTKDELVIKALPATRLACPGLDRYASQFEDVRVEQQYRTAIVFYIPENTEIPDVYKAGGNNCFVEIAPDGSDIFVEKMACKSVCLDQVNTPDGQLKIALASDEEVKQRECLTVFDLDPKTKETVALPKPAHCKV
jgi:hypothetical protein